MYDVLIVEDELVIRNGIANSIDWNSIGFQIAGQCSTGQEGLDFVLNNHVDVILTDIRMPEMDGLKMSEIIHQIYPHIQIIILSGYADFTYAVQALHFTAFDYLLKPVEKAKLIQCFISLYSCLQSRQQPAGTAVPEAPEMPDEADGEGETGPSQQFLAGRGAHSSHEAIMQIKEYIDEQYANDLTLEKLSRTFFMSSSYISYLFKTTFGESYSDHLRNIRLTKARELIEKYPDLKINEIARMVGFREYKYFSLQFKQMYGVSPTDIRRSESKEQP